MKLHKEAPIIRIIDFETTSLDTKKAKVCQVGWADLDIQAKKVLHNGEILTNPGIPIPAETSGVHNITDDMVKNSPPALEIIEEILDVDYPLAAHNTLYDMVIAQQQTNIKDNEEEDWICTCNIAKHLWPESPNHKNNTLRYWLKLNIPNDLGVIHNAKMDSFITAILLMKEIDTLTNKNPNTSLDDILDLSYEPALLKHFSFGKYRGDTWEEHKGDIGYFQWILNRDGFTEDIYHTAKNAIEGIFV